MSNSVIEGKSLILNSPPLVGGDEGEGDKCLFSMFLFTPTQPSPVNGEGIIV